jgi:hypothetical protein
MLRTVAAILGGVLGAVLGCYAGAFGRVGYMYLTHPGYASDMDYAGGLFGMAGAVLGGAVGPLLGLWLASRAASR